MSTVNQILSEKDCNFEYNIMCQTKRFLIIILGIFMVFFSGCSYSEQEGIEKVNMQYHNQIKVIVNSFFEEMRHSNIREMRKDIAKSKLCTNINSIYLPKVSHLADRLKIEKYGTQEQRALIGKEIILTKKYFINIAKTLNSGNNDELLKSHDLSIIDRELFNQSLLYEDYYGKLLRGKSIINFNTETISNLKLGSSYKDICSILGFPGKCKENKRVFWNEEERLIEVYLWSRDTEKLYIVFINGKAIKFSSEFKWYLFNMN